MSGNYIVNFIKSGKVTTLSFSARFIYFVATVLFVVVAGFSYVIYDYYGLKKSDIQFSEMKEDIVRKTDLIHAQRARIQYYAKKLNLIQKKLEDVDQLETKIRIIANLDKKGDSKGETGVFGVGGAMPEPIETRIGLDFSHNTMAREVYNNINVMDEASSEKLGSLKDLLLSLELKKSFLASMPSIKPARGWVTSHFGYRLSPFTGKKEFHSGLDIANKKGTSIIATANGIVSFAGKRGLLGNAVMIDHGHGIITKYGHLSKILVKKGKKVERGDVIGKIGNTGRSTGPHLHYAVYLNGRSVDPSKYILD